jgi:hypothetical protein
MPHHHKICLFESHYNTLHNVVGIYWWNFSISIFTNEFYRRFNSVGKVICKTYMSLYCLDFFIHSFSITIPSVYTVRIFLLVFTDGFTMENSVGKCITIYRWKNFINVSISICQFFGSGKSQQMIKMTHKSKNWCNIQCKNINPKMLANLETQQQSLNPKNAIKLKKSKT